jgi:hypothetical protein
MIMLMWSCMRRTQMVRNGKPRTNKFVKFVKIGKKFVKFVKIGGKT